MRDAFAKVHLFHATVGVPHPHRPTLIPADRVELRNKLILEELTEYNEAVQANDLTGIADALVGLAYVVIGAAVEHGLARFDEMFGEAHRSNMSKMGPDGKPMYREDGKVMKGPNFSPPDLAPFVLASDEIRATERIATPPGAAGTAPILMSAANPNGAKLEDVLLLLAEEIAEKSKKITLAAPGTHARFVGRTVLSNNDQIVGLLIQAAAIQRHTLAHLDTLGPDQGPTGTPRL